MKIDREDWIFCTGKSGYGKTFFIKKHIEAIPQGRAYILDFNCNDYQEFLKNQNLWNVRFGTQEEIEEFMKIPYGQGNCFCVLEEADNYLYYETGMVRRFVLTARNRGIGAFVSAKRAKAVKPVYRNRFTHLILFHNDLSEDIAYLENWAGYDRGRLEYLRKLQVGEHVIIDMTKNTISDVKKL